MGKPEVNKHRREKGRGASRATILCIRFSAKPDPATEILSATLFPPTWSKLTRQPQQKWKMEKKTNGEKPSRAGSGAKDLSHAPPKRPRVGARRFPPFSGANHSQSLAPGSICRKPPPPPLQCTKRWGGVNRGRNKELNPAGPVSGSHFYHERFAKPTATRRSGRAERGAAQPGRALQTMRQQRQPKGRAGPRAASSPSLPWERREDSLTWPGRVAIKAAGRSRGLGELLQAPPPAAGAAGLPGNQPMELFACIGYEWRPEGCQRLKAPGARAPSLYPGSF